MLRNISKTVGSALAAMCLVSTLAMAQDQRPSQSQYPSQPIAPQYGNTTERQGRMQNPSEGQMQRSSQEQIMRLLCTRDNGKGRCTAATGIDGKEFVVNGDGVKSGGYMNCVDRGSVVDCEPAS